MGCIEVGSAGPELINDVRKLGRQVVNALQHFLQMLTGTMCNEKSVDHDLNEVRTLFNAKARTWNKKYQAGGALTFRICGFERLLTPRLPLGAKVLDLGCGTGAISAVLSAGGFRVTACDIAEEMIETGKQMYRDLAIEWRLLPLDWKQLPFDPETFSGIVASSVLEYVPEVSGVLLECQRVLKRGGMLVATVPNPSTMTRRLENVLRPLAPVICHLPGLNGIQKIQSYGSYLNCSRNRMSITEWRAIAARAQFTVEHIGTEANNPALIFLAFRRES
jgi:2-polyprenyl-3-methyl-5-hydroxy-6-metoxy-1,4-benzoquinol methylase